MEKLTTQAASSVAAAHTEDPNKHSFSPFLSNSPKWRGKAVGGGGLDGKGAPFGPESPRAGGVDGSNPETLSQKPFCTPFRSGLFPPKC